MRVAVVCFDFKLSNIRLQPWRYIYEISKGITSKNIDLLIISDGSSTSPTEDNIDGINITRLDTLRSLPFRKNDHLISVIEKYSPDIILWSLNNTSFYFYETIKTINKPIVVLWQSTFYDLSYILSLGLSELIRNFNSLLLYVINSFIPNLFIKKVLMLPSIKKVITLNENSKKSLMKYGLLDNDIFVIPPGIHDYDLELPDMVSVENKKLEIIDKNNFIILYLGSPLSLRGIDTLIEAVSNVKETVPSLQLVILSRRRSNNLIKEDDYIKDLCCKKGIQNNTIIISKFLERNDIKEFIVLADVIALPFKIVQSDTPTSILEVMSLGKTVISTKVDGIPELLAESRGYLVNPNDSVALAKSILYLYSNSSIREKIGVTAREYMLEYPKWDQITQNFLKLFEQIIV
ncbi:glycosyltransferase family 4 protein [Methanosarcina sp. UBA289]|uniref:glycosyltransferase family 4 protein n=1 Tax=Methanosarcina sp. UBA289 TaxID=1915574 RepID=UPI0025F4E22E|nr:glycosyltransferase family 4 protein [Methanosarcina sp. UBA289]